MAPIESTLVPWFRCADRGSDATIALLLLSCPSNSAFLSKLFHSVTVYLSHDLHALSLIQTHYHTTTFATTRSDTPCTSPRSSIKTAHFLIGFAVHHSQALQRGYACARHRQDIVLSAALRTASEPLSAHADSSKLLLNATLCGAQDEARRPHQAGAPSNLRGVGFAFAEA